MLHKRSRRHIESDDCEISITATSKDKFVAAEENHFDSDMEEEGEDEGNEEETKDKEDGEDSDDEDEERKNQEMEDLEREYADLQKEEQNMLKNLRRHDDEDAKKGQAVKNQKVLWEKMLEFRFLLQKTFSSSNKVPKEPIRSTFCNSDEAVERAYSDLIDSSINTLNSFFQLQEALIENNPSIVLVTNARECSEVENFLEDVDNREWLQMQKLHDRIIPFRNNSVDKWQRKTQVITGAAALKGRFHAFNQSVSDQVADFMRDPSRMVKRMCSTSSSVKIFGEVLKEPVNAKEASEDVDPELIDDSEFYQQLLKEFLESCRLGASEGAFQTLQRLPKRRKVVERRASKGRKTRYNVHEKIENFLAPMPFALRDMYPKVLTNLFATKTASSANL